MHNPGDTDKSGVKAKGGGGELGKVGEGRGKRGHLQLCQH